MKNYRYILGFALLVAGAMPAFSQVSNNNEDEVYKTDQHFARDYVQGEVLFKLKDGQQAKVRRAGGVLQSAGISSLDAILKENGAQEMEQLLPNAKVTGSPRRAKAFNGATIVERDLTQLYKVTLKDEKVQNTMQLVEQLKTLDEVEFAEPNYKVYLTDANIAGSFGGNPYVTQQWYLDNYGVKQLWNKPIINPKRPVIAIIDTGVDMTHPDIAPNLWTNTAEAEGETNYDNDGNGFKGDVHGWDFINNTPNVRDFNMHGTHVAGIAAAANNGIGIIGANPMALIMPISVMQSDGTGDVATIVKGIDYAVQNGATILNLSLGTYANSRAMRQALERAYQKAVIVAAAGNDGWCINSPHHPQPCPGATPMFPAAYSFVLGVQATQSNGSLAGFSNYDDDGNTFSSVTTIQDQDGFNYELSAPGTNMLSTIPGGKYKVLQGTSMAAPLVAGAISALKMVKQYDTQEILWGDLLHTSNIAQAYAVTNRPAELDLMKVMYRERKELVDETEEDYSGDGRIDAGETVDLYPVIRTTFGGASNIKMYLEMGDEFEDPNTVQIITDKNHKVEFGLHLDAYGKGVSLNPLKLRVAENVVNGRHIKMKFVATCDETNTVYEGLFTLVVDNMKKISGVVNEDMTLTSDHEWLVTGNLAVPEGVTLTIEPGTIIKFTDATSISCSGTIIANGEPGRFITFTRYDNNSHWKGIRCDNTFSYCKFEHVLASGFDFPKLNNSIITDCFLFGDGRDLILSYCNFTDHLRFRGGSGGGHQSDDNKFNNYINNYYDQIYIWSTVKQSNFFNNYITDWWITTFDMRSIGVWSESPVINRSDEPSYLGSSIEEIARQSIADINSGYGFGSVDLSNMRTTPVAEAHGIVWKVCVNGKDAQDEYEDLAPLGIGKHKFEVYFNRPMNKEKIPQISFGVREPYTQNAVAEDGSWNEEGTIYTAYKTITGKTKSDGVNRIYVWGAEDNEFFECPYEKTRFNVMINAAGSMATGFAAEAGRGRVNLSWNNENNDFDDAMGFNIYRYTIDEAGKADTICINKEIVDIETTEYSDYDVTPGTTYYYMYKVLSTDLKEFDVSNVVAVTPLTATLGDANGSGDVDVADVITIVNYIAGQEPKPFIFEAADMNTDKMIDILDIVGVIQKLLPQSATSRVMAEATAVYSIEDGVLYVESPVALAGVQVQLTMEEPKTIQVTSDLDGFEQASAWLTDNDYLFLAYNMNGKTLSAGKHALLKIGDATLSGLALSDEQGHNVMLEAASGTTQIENTNRIEYRGNIYNLKGFKVGSNTSDLQKQPKGVYIVNGKKVMK